MRINSGNFNNSTSPDFDEYKNNKGTILIGKRIISK